MKKTNKLTQKQYNNLITETETIKEILSKTLKHNYTDIYTVNQTADFCNTLYKMEHLEVREFEGLEIVCYRTVDGYDNQIIKFCII